MSAHNLDDQLKSPQLDMGASGRALKTAAGYLLAWGTAVPTDATEGYAPGCIFIHTDGAAYNTVLYCNVGTKASCDFNVVTVAS